MKKTTKTTKYTYIRQDPWGGYGVFDNHEVLARSLNFDEAEAIARETGKTIKVVDDYGTMTLR
jgi:hypothetical protein